MAENKVVPKLRFKEFEGEWEEKKLGDVLTIGSGKDYKHLNQGTIPVYGSSGDLIASVDEYLYNGNSVGIGRKGTIDKPIWLTNKFWTVDTLFFTKDFDGVIELFLFYVFQNINWRLHNEASGVPSLSKRTIEKINSLLPTLPEQKKIADFLSSVDNKLQHLKKKKELLEQYKKGLMQKIFSQEIRFKDDNGNDYPDWEEKRLGSFCTFFSGGTPSSKNQDYYSGTIPFIGSGDINNSSVSKYISDKALTNSSSKLVDVGDLLYALYGATSGECAISKISGAINQAVLCIRSTQSLAYLYFILSFNKERIISKYLQGGQGNLSAQIIKDLKFKIYSLPEQKKIADFLSSVDNKIELVGTQITQTESFKKGLLQQMFVAA